MVVPEQVENEYVEPDTVIGTVITVAPLEYIAAV